MRLPAALNLHGHLVEHGAASHVQHVVIIHPDHAGVPVGAACLVKGRGRGRGRGRVRVRVRVRVRGRGRGRGRGRVRTPSAQHIAAAGAAG